MSTSAKGDRVASGGGGRESLGRFLAPAWGQEACGRAEGLHRRPECLRWERLGGVHGIGARRGSPGNAGGCSVGFA